MVLSRGLRNEERALSHESKPRRRFCIKAWPRMITRAVWSRLSPRIGGASALSRPWSASIRLFAYCSVLWNAPGMSSSIPPATRGPIGHDLRRLAVRAERSGEEPSRGPGVAPG